MIPATMPGTPPPSPPIARFAAVAGVFALVVWTLLRVALWIATGPAQAGWAYAPGMFVRGLGFDLATLACAIAPWLLVSALLPDRWRGTRAIIALRWLLLWLVVAALLFGAAA
jgi:hypothetical protein